MHQLIYSMLKVSNHLITTSSHKTVKKTVFGGYESDPWVPPQNKWHNQVCCRTRHTLL